jgi:hypothetical protein
MKAGMSLLKLTLIALAGMSAVPAIAQVGQTVIIPDPNTDPQNAQSAATFRELRTRPDDDAAVIAQLKAGQLDQPPYFLLELARRLLPTDKAAATEYWLLARVRMLYDGQRCTDRSAMADFNMRFFATPETEAITADRAAMDAAAAKLLKRGDLFVGRADPWWICLHGIGSMGAGLAGEKLSRGDYLKPESEWPAIQQRLIASLEPKSAAAAAAPR